MSTSGRPSRPRRHERGTGTVSRTLTWRLASPKCRWRRSNSREHESSHARLSAHRVGVYGWSPSRPIGVRNVVQSGAVGAWFERAMSPKSPLRGLQSLRRQLRLQRHPPHVRIRSKTRNHQAGPDRHEHHVGRLRGPSVIRRSGSSTGMAVQGAEVERLPFGARSPP